MHDGMEDCLVPSLSPQWRWFTGSDKALERRTHHRTGRAVNGRKKSSSMLSGLRQVVPLTRALIRKQQQQTTLVAGALLVGRRCEFSVSASTTVIPRVGSSPPPPPPSASSSPFAPTATTTTTTPITSATGTREEKSQEAWRLSRRIVECGPDYERLLQTMDECVEAFAPINMAIAAQRLAQAALTPEARARVATSACYRRLVERLHANNALADLNPQHLAATVTSLRRLGTDVDLSGIMGSNNSNKE